MNTECTICLQTYTAEGVRAPKLLPCSHTLCLGCLKELVKGPKMDCPECRTRNTVPKGGAKGFPTNRYCACVCMCGGVRVCDVRAQFERACVCVCAYAV